MKLSTQIIVGAAILAFLTMAAGELQAQVTNLITIAGTAELQGDAKNNGTFITIAAPTVLTLDTKQILVFLAVDEHAEGNYSAAKFPANAKLVEIDSDSGAD